MPKYKEANKEHINKYKMAHMVGVAEYMRERAKDYGIDPDAAYAVGLLHDIGYLEGRHDHEMSSRDILEKIGVTDETVLDAVALHGSDPYQVKSEYGEDCISSLLVLTYEADMSVDAMGFRVGFNKRLEDIEVRLKGTEYYDSAVMTSRNTVKFVKEWQQENGISKPPKDFFDIAPSQNHRYK